jgi:hypothetical protein
MTQTDQVFVVYVLVIDLTQEMMVSNVINQPTGAIMELNVIVKICKYKGLYERHHFIPMAMEVHDAPVCDMDCFIEVCAHLFHNKQLGDHLLLFFGIQFLKQCVSIYKEEYCIGG